MKFRIILALLGCSFIFGQNYSYEVTVTNLTKGQVFSPPVAVSHGRDYSLFQLGQPASTALYTMAEDGMNGMIMAEALAHDDVLDAASADGPLMPGHSVTLSVDGAFGRDQVTVAGMLVTTNDAFFAVRGVQVRGPLFKNGFGYVKQLAWAYDAGSEYNSQECADIPGPPCGNPGVRVTDNAEGYVYIHNGVSSGGDLDPAAHDWRGPVALVSIRVVRN